MLQTVTSNRRVEAIKKKYIKGANKKKGVIIVVVVVVAAAVVVLVLAVTTQKYCFQIPKLIGGTNHTARLQISQEPDNIFQAFSQMEFVLY